MDTGKRPDLSAVSNRQHGQASVADVANLCKLLDPTAGTTTTTTSESSASGSNLADACFSGRPVMVPLTTKAFFSGTLQPPVCAASKGEEKEVPSWEKERVLMNLGPTTTTQGARYDEHGSFYAEMSRKDGAEVLRRRLESMMIVNNNRNSSSVKKGKEITKIKKGEMKEKNTSATTKPGQVQGQSSSSPAPANFLPYFEIREEYDSSGEVIKAEAIDVTEELKFLAKESKKEKQQSGEESESENDSEDEDIIRAKRITKMEEGSGKMTTTSYPFSVAPVKVAGSEVGGIEDVDMTSSAHATDSQDGNAEGANQVTSDRYQSISSRLDELILAEERYEKEKEINEQSSKKIKGKGWGKGFLGNRDKSRRKEHVQEEEKKATRPREAQKMQAMELQIKEKEGIELPLKQTSTETSQGIAPVKAKSARKEAKREGGWGKGFLLDNKSSPPKKQSNNHPAELQNEEEKESGNRVHFRDSNEVRVIAEPSGTVSAESSAQIDKTFNAFSGVVTERNAAASHIQEKVPATTASRMKDENRNTGSGVVPARGTSRFEAQSAPSVPPSAGKKKMSRFAQRRLAERGGG